MEKESAHTPEESGADTIEFTVQDTETEQKEHFCGVGSFRPKCLQVFRNAKFFTFLLCCNSFSEGALVTGFVSVVLSSLERRYHLTNTEVGLIPSTFDMAVLVTVIFISYFGGTSHKPRWMGVSLLIQGLGALIFALPEFIFGRYAADLSMTNTTTHLESCADGVDFTPNCDVTGNNRYSLIFFYIGNIVIGVGASPLFTIGPSYIDDIIHPKHVSVHLGVFFMCAILGPALGYGLGAAFLSIYVDFWEETTLTPSDPGWVGAWWLCFLFGALVSWLLAIPFLMFPKLLPDSHLVKADREMEMAQKYSAKQGKDSSAEKTVKAKLTSFPRHVMQVLATPSWVCITIGICFLAFVVDGIATFGPKYYEAQFSLSAPLASLAVGGSAIPTGALGVLVGALIIRHRKGRTVALINWIMTIIAMPPLLSFLISCPTVQLAGVNVPFADGTVLPQRVGPTVSSCNANCSCTSSIFEPVCGADNLTYFSPCRAGCDGGFLNDDPQYPIFENCSCVAASLAARLELASEEEVLTDSFAVGGMCDNGCNLFGVFISLSLLALFLLFILEVPNVVITIRCVADEQRALALGMQSFLFRLTGNIPGPIVFGVIFDAACIYFRFDVPCNERGNCWVYDTHQLSWSITAVVLLGVFLKCVFSLFTWLTYPKQNAEEKGSEGQLQAAVELTANEIPQGEVEGKTRPKLESINSQSQLIPNPV